jgi:hypothetical protein
MVSSYFENVAPIVHFVHMPTVNSWLNDMLEEYKGIQSRPIEPSKRAVIFMILALVQSHENAESSEGNADLRYDINQIASQNLHHIIVLWSLIVNQFSVFPSGRKAAGCRDR